MPSGHPTAKGTVPGRGRRGVTLFEVVVVMVLIGILAGIAFNNVGQQLDGRAVRSAENTFLTLQARGRSVAVEGGAVVRYRVNPDDDQLVLVLDDGEQHDTIEAVNFQDNHGVDVHSDWGNVELCMTPRGFADPGCSDSPFGPFADVNLSRGSERGGVRLRALGEVERR